MIHKIQITLARTIAARAGMDRTGLRRLRTDCCLSQGSELGLDLGQCGFKSCTACRMRRALRENILTLQVECLLLAFVLSLAPMRLAFSFVAL